MTVESLAHVVLKVRNLEKSIAFYLEKPGGGGHRGAAQAVAPAARDARLR